MNPADVAAMNAVLLGAPDAEIVACEAESRAAQLTADIVALDRLIAEDLLWAYPFFCVRGR